MKSTLLLVLYALLSLTGFSQTRIYQGSYLSVGAAHLQLKDQLNHGLVFSGPDILVSYGIQRISPNQHFELGTALITGGISSDGTWAFRASLSPIQTHYAWNLVKNPSFCLYLGPAFQAVYDVQGYPELHAGPISWMAYYDLGLFLSATFPLANKPVEVQLQHTTFSLSSRPSPDRDPYYFSAQVGENVGDMHRNMSFGSLDRFQQIHLQARIYLNSNRSLTYDFRYTAYNETPQLEIILHGLAYTWYLRKSNP